MLKHNISTMRRRIRHESVDYELEEEYPLCVKELDGTYVCTLPPVASGALVKELEQNNDRMKTELKRFQDQIKRKQEEINSLNSQLTHVRSNSQLTHVRSNSQLTHVRSNTTTVLEYEVDSEHQTKNKQDIPKINSLNSQPTQKTLKTETKPKHQVNTLDQVLDLAFTENKSEETLNSGEILCYHFNEVVKKYHAELAEKTQQIAELQARLAQCRDGPRDRHETQVCSCHELSSDAQVQEECLRRRDESSSSSDSNTEEESCRRTDETSSSDSHAEEDEIQTRDPGGGRDEERYKGPDAASCSNPRVEDERLRRTDAAVRVFQKDLGAVKTQLKDWPLTEEKFPCTTQKDKYIVDELRRRQNFGVIADLERMGQTFFEKLKFEEELDKRHWELENKLLQEHKQRYSDECEPDCSYNKEFERLASTRNNLHKALKDFKALLDAKESRKNALRTTPITTIQNIYNPLELSTKSARSRSISPEK